MLADIKTTERMTGKMVNMKSLNGDFAPSCWLRGQDPDSPCHDDNCYSKRAMKRFPNAKNRFQKNTDAMVNVLLPSAALPRINASIFRFNAHGELWNVTHARNLLRICNANKRTQFSLWTHEPKLVIEALKQEGGKPDNLILIYSSPKFNKQAKLPMYFDKVFTVYTKDGAENVEINCGSRKCFDCLKCYDPNNKETHIRELKK